MQDNFITMILIYHKFLITTKETKHEIKVHVVKTHYTVIIFPNHKST